MLSCHEERNPPVDQLREHRHACCFTGTILGMLFGVADTISSWFMGYEVRLNGEPAFAHQMVFHVMVFMVLGYFAGRFYEGRRRLQEAYAIIASQLATLKANQEQLLQSEKLAVIGKMAASIAHEIRNPLGIMRSAVGLVSEDLAQDHPGHQPLEFIRDEIDRLSGLIGGLLVTAKPREAIRSMADLDEVLDRAQAFTAPELRKRRIVVDRVRAGTLPQVCIDAHQVHQVVLGLIINAAEAIRERGRIEVATGVEDRAHGRQVFLEIRDTGPGIPEDALEKVFEPFYSTKQEGTGLGLSVAREIIRGHDGEIRARTRAGSGAIFHITFPVAAPATLPPVPLPPVPVVAAPHATALPA